MSRSGRQYREKRFKAHQDYRPRSICGKVAFNSHDDAMRRACEILERDTNRTSQFRAYQCKHCSMWHLTSSPWMSREQRYGLIKL